MENIMVIGAAGQIGSELVVELRKIYGNQRVYATDIKQPRPACWVTGLSRSWM
jgi:nucleoside-diphosphate-sugar epimerase